MLLFKKNRIKLPYRSLTALFDAACVRYANLPAFENFGSQITYQAVDEQAQQFASYLQQQGLVKGDRIALQLPNVMAYPVALLGALRAGLIVVNTNPLYTTAEMRYQFEDADIRAVVILANFAHRLEPLCDTLSLKAVVIAHVGDGLGYFKGGLLNFAAKYIKRSVPTYRLPEAHTFSEALRHGAARAFTPPPPAKQEDIALLQYTGGTTGVARGAMLTHANLVSNVVQMLQWQGAVFQPKRERFITPLPLYHIFSFTASLLMPFELGAVNVLVTNPRDINGLIKTLKQRPFSLLTGVNTLFRALLQANTLKQVDFSQSKLVIGGGMAIAPEVAEQWKEVTGMYLTEGYGLTEASPVVACNSLKQPGPNQGVGFPIPGTSVKVVSPTGKTLRAGKRGELWVRGPQVMRGYWQSPETTAVTFHDKWLKTGDIAFIAPNGAVHLVDRKKELINVSGFNVYPSEVESVASTHPAVVEAGAVGVPDKRTGEAIKLCVVLKPGEKLTAAALRQHCRQALTGYKLPQHICFLASLPKSVVGKVLRRALRDIPLEVH